MSKNNAVETPPQTPGAERDFPVVLHNDRQWTTLDEITAWIAATRSELAATLAKSGAILFRGFPLRTAEDFDAFVTAFGWPNFPYDESLSNAVRVNRTPRIFTANEAPPEITIFLHHEMAQTPVYPSKLFFFCEQPARPAARLPSAVPIDCGSSWRGASRPLLATARRRDCGMRTPCRRRATAAPAWAEAGATRCVSRAWSRRSSGWRIWATRGSGAPTAA